MNTRVSAGSVAHTVDFFVSSQEIPGCDIILGTPFLTYAKAVVDHEGQAVVFPGDKRWHSLNVFPIAVSPDIRTVPNIRLVEAKEAAHFLRLHRKNVQVYQVTVGELQTIVSASADTGKAGGQFSGDPRIVELVKRYRSRMFSDRVPLVPHPYHPYL